MSDMEFNKIFAMNLKRYMSDYELTQAELGKRLNVSTTTIYYWLTGTKTPRMDKIDAICQIFHCKRSDLINERSEQERILTAYMEAIEDINVRNVIDKFMLLDMKSQNDVMDYLDFVLSKQYKKALDNGGKVG